MKCEICGVRECEENGHQIVEICTNDECREKVDFLNVLYGVLLRMQFETEAISLLGEEE